MVIGDSPVPAPIVPSDGNLADNLKPRTTRGGVIQQFDGVAAAAVVAAVAAAAVVAVVYQTTPKFLQNFANAVAATFVNHTTLQRKTSNTLRVRTN